VLPTDRKPTARFVFVFLSYTAPGEWITAARLSQRILPAAPPELVKEVSRKLSNLNRFGYLERRLRPDQRDHEYAHDPSRPALLPPSLRRPGFLILPDASLCSCKNKSAGPIDQ
jgi:hypothetical protein